MRLLHRHIMAIQPLDPVRFPELVFDTGTAIDKGQAGAIPSSGGNAQESYRERSSWPGRTYLCVHTFVGYAMGNMDGVAGKTNKQLGGRTRRIIIVAWLGWLEGSSVDSDHSHLWLAPYETRINNLPHEYALRKQ